MQSGPGSDASDERWARIVSISEGVDFVSVPSQVSRIDGRPRAASRKATRFAEALAFSDGWSGIAAARERRGRRDDLAA